MAAGLYTYPLFVSLLAAPLLGEIVGRWRVGALIIGAAGALLMLNPLAETFSLAQLLPIAAGFFYACNIIILRRYCRGETPLALTFANGAMFFISGLLYYNPVHLAAITKLANCYAFCSNWLASTRCVCHWLCSFVFSTEFVRQSRPDSSLSNR